jgi:amino acid adenylation domain-containing protein
MCIVCLDKNWPTISRKSDENPAIEITTKNLAYLIYTSGSTGRPKGVMIRHRSVCNRLLWERSAYNLTEADRILQSISFSFDVSVRIFFEPLTVGAKLILARSDRQHDSAYIVRLISEWKITAATFTPSMLQVFLNEQGVENCNCLRRVNTGGEVLPFELQERFFACLDADLYVGYGPTEATIGVTNWVCKRESSRFTVPIGRPIANTQIYILDCYLQPVPIGMAGEIHIGGVCLARGYFNRNELTAKKFIPNPFSPDPKDRLYKTGDLARYRPDGNIEFLGRKDNQIKIRGFRIELGEIEAVLREHPTVREAVVLAREDKPGDKRLVAYIVPYEKPKPTMSELQMFLKENLPDYMIPSVFLRLNTLPLTFSGKVDRRALPIPDYFRLEERGTYIAPRNEVEKAIAAIWQKLLGSDKVGIHDNFFELGGHSLLATQLISRLRDTLNVELPVRNIFDTPTVAGLAKSIEKIAQEDRENIEQIDQVLKLAEHLSNDEVKRFLAQRKNKK